MPCVTRQLPFTMEDQLIWAAACGARVSFHFGFLPHSQELDDLRQVATYKMLELYQRPARGTFSERRQKYVEKGFNLRRVPKGGSAEGLFRGWAYKWIENDCVRAALQLRNGGTYKTTRPENKPAAVITLGLDAEWVEDTPPPEDCQELSHSPDRRAGRLPVTMDDLGMVAIGRRLAKGRNRLQ